MRSSRWSFSMRSVTLVDLSARRRCPTPLGIVSRSYRLLCERIAEAEVLRSSVADWTCRGIAHPVFGTIRLETITTWKSMRRGTAVLGDRVLDRLHAEVTRRVAVRIGARLVR